MPRSDPFYDRNGYFYDQILRAKAHSESPKVAKQNVQILENESSKM